MTVRRASAMDRGGGEQFTVKPVAPGDIVVEGWSGSVVLDRDGPLGIVVNVDGTTNEALAVRVDAIRRLMAPAAPASDPVAAASAAPSIGVLAGTTVDPASGPEELLSTAGTSWEVAPKQRTVVFSLQFPAPVPLHHLQLVSSWTGENRIEALNIDTKAGPDAADWTWANYCKVETRGVSADCRFLTRTVSSVRVLVKTRSDQPIGLESLTVE